MWLFPPVKGWRPVRPVRPGWPSFSALPPKYNCSANSASFGLKHNLKNWLKHWKKGRVQRHQSCRQNIAKQIITGSFHFFYLETITWAWDSNNVEGILTLTCMLWEATNQSSRNTSTSFLLAREVRTSKKVAANFNETSPITVYLLKAQLHNTLWVGTSVSVNLRQ